MVIFTLIFLEIFVATQHLGYIIPPPHECTLEERYCFCDTNDKIQIQSYYIICWMSYGKQRAQARLASFWWQSSVYWVTLHLGRFKDLWKKSTTGVRAAGKAFAVDSVLRTALWAMAQQALTLFAVSTQTVVQSSTLSLLVAAAVSDSALSHSFSFTPMAILTPGKLEIFQYPSLLCSSGDRKR